MDIFTEYLASIDDEKIKSRMTEVLTWVTRKFPTLGTRIAWSSPMFTDHGTFIISFSSSKKHLQVAPERDALIKFSDAIKQAGYSQTQELLRIPWDSPVDYKLLEEIIQFNIADKAEINSFWRKAPPKE